MIALSAPTFDIDGPLVSQAGAAALKSYGRRAQRVSVLDLAVGAVLVDGGSSPADQTYTLTIPDTSGAGHARLAEMTENYPSLVMSCSRGCFLVLVSAVDYSNGNTTANAEVLEALS